MPGTSNEDTSLSQPTASASASTNFRNDASSSASVNSRRNEVQSNAQPKQCARCGQQLDLSHDRPPLLLPDPSSTSASAPSPSSYAFAPESVRSHHRIQPHPSLTSAINAAAASALSRHLNGNEEAFPTDQDGHTICTQCAAQMSETEQHISASEAAAVAANHDVEMSDEPNYTTSQNSQNAASNPSSTSVSSPAASGNQLPPQPALSISVANMGAGGDAVAASHPSISPMDDTSAFPPLAGSAASSTLRGPPSPPLDGGRSSSRGRIRFADLPVYSPIEDITMDSHQRHLHSLPQSRPHQSHDGQPHAYNSVTATTPVSGLGRSGSFSRSLSYNGTGPESVSSSSVPVVSFPASSSSPIASVSAPTSAYLEASSTPFSPAPDSGTHHMQTRPRSSSGASNGTHAHSVPAPAHAIPGGVKQRRPSSSRRLSRTFSSTGPTTIPFAAVSGTGDPMIKTNQEDPFGPGAVTRPRLSQLPMHIIADDLHHAALKSRPPSFASCSRIPPCHTSTSAPILDLHRAVKYHVDPLAVASTSKHGDDATGSVDGSSNEASAFSADGLRWFDLTEPDPLIDISRLRSPPKGRGCLYPGAQFHGTQKSGRNSYDVTVRIVNVDLEASHLCGYLNIRGLTEDWPELTTYFDAEIIGDRYGFVTGKWGATEADDLKHWARFPPFRPLRSALSKPGLRFNHLNKPYVFMRWKEKFLVPDHRVRDINGASFAGFYYVCVELGDSAGRPPVYSETSAQTRGRSNSHMTANGGLGSNATSPVLPLPSNSSPPAPSGQQWYAARTQRRRELSLSSPQYPQHPSVTPSLHTLARAPSSQPLQSAPGFWPASPTSPTPMVEDTFSGMAWTDSASSSAMSDYDDLGAAGKMSGFYFHENSEPYQQLSLHHLAEAASSSFELH